MNKNHKRQVESARDAFAKVKRGRGSVTMLSEFIGYKPRLSKYPKVGRSASEISRRFS